MLNILVTGSNGQLGQEFKRIVQGKNNKERHYLFETRQTLDITNADDVNTYFQREEIDICINCAAYTNVNKAEEDVKSAYLVNETGPENLARACKKYKATLIHFSTDYVFDGHSSTLYKENDKTNPQTVYGKSKLAGENKIIESGCKYLIFRVSWLYSEFGNNFVKTMTNMYKSLPEGKNDVRVVNDQYGFPTYAGLLAENIIRIIDEKQYLNKQGIYHYCDSMEDNKVSLPVSWFQFALEIFRNLKSNNVQTNWFPAVLPCRTDDFTVIAPRPNFSAMSTLKFRTDFEPVLRTSWDQILELFLKKFVKMGK